MIKREGSGYHDAKAEGSFVSATAIRKIITDKASVNYSRSEIASGLNGLMPDISLGAMLAANSSNTFSFPDYAGYMRSCMIEASSRASLDDIAYMSDDLSGYIRSWKNF